MLDVKILNGNMKQERILLPECTLVYYNHKLYFYYGTLDLINFTVFMLLVEIMQTLNFLIIEIELLLTQALLLSK